MEKIGIICGDYKILKLKGIFNKKRIFIVECIVCGNTKEMQYAEFIRQKNIHSVKNCKMNYMNKEVGKQYGDFIVESVNEDFSYNVKCIYCSKQKTLIYNELTTNKRVAHKHCSNGDDDLTKEWKKFHSIWTSMRTRTTNKNCKYFSYYGGRGITSNDYINFIDFKNDFYVNFLESVNKYGFENVSIDRIDNSKSYTKENIRFTDKKTQARNTRRIKDIIATSPNGDVFEFSIIKDFATEHNLCNSSIVECLKNRQKQHNGWSFKYK